MKCWMKPVMIVLPMIFLTVGCSNQNPAGPEQFSDPYDEIFAANNDIDLLDSAALSDSSEAVIENHFRRALVRLNHLLLRVGHMVRNNDNEEAEDLFTQALEAKEKAIEAADEKDFETAFDYILESAHLAIEAAKIIREEIKEEIEEIIERLRTEMANLKETLDEIAALLEENENWRAERLFFRAQRHFSHAKTAFQNHHWRRAVFHLKRAKKLAEFALRILNASNP